MDSQSQKPIITFTDVSFTYANLGQQNTIGSLSITINPGEVVLFTGMSGCGKSSVIRMINGLIPHFHDGKKTGEICINGINTVEQELHNYAATIGSVFQNPRTQFFNIDTDSELAFTCENLGMDSEVIVKRVASTVEQMQLYPLLNRSMFTLSGGQKQWIACAAIMPSEPQIIVLDEPSANLDYHNIGKLMRIIAHWKQQGKTIIIAEHRLFYLTELIDSVLYMEKGKIVQTYDAQTFINEDSSLHAKRGLRPLHDFDQAFINVATKADSEFARLKNDKDDYADSDKLHRDNGHDVIDETRLQIDKDDYADSDKLRRKNGHDVTDESHHQIDKGDCGDSNKIRQDNGHDATDESRALDAGTERFAAEESLVITALEHTYKDGSSIHLTDVTLPKGKIIGVVGPNGAGKSTFGRCLVGLVKKAKVAVEGYTNKALARNSFMVFQDVNHQLFTESVKEEIVLSLPDRKDTRRVDEIVAALNLGDFVDMHPMALSGGQKQRVAIASALASERDIIVLDEPTSGLDLRHMQDVANVLQELKAMGKTVIVITHDVQLVLSACEHIVHIEDGLCKANYPLHEGTIDLLRDVFSTG